RPSISLLFSKWSLKSPNMQLRAPWAKNVARAKMLVPQCSGRTGHSFWSLQEAGGEFMARRTKDRSDRCKIGAAKCFQQRAGTHPKLAL
ncbi:hypothetical protein, partial [Thiosulfatihalobacter marinus]|uniref:hypothetical protein n=1 Tax=Thiosulfatihalobacter marinus TaxID=2792481 RepID=UPI001E31150A